MLDWILTGFSYILNFVTSPPWRWRQHFSAIRTWLTAGLRGVAVHRTASSPEAVYTDPIPTARFTILTYLIWSHQTDIISQLSYHVTVLDTFQSVAWLVTQPSRSPVYPGARGYLYRKLILAMCVVLTDLHKWAKRGVIRLATRLPCCFVWLWIEFCCWGNTNC